MVVFKFSGLCSHSLMFWINAGPGDRATLEKTWMDGSERSSVSVLTAQSAHGLTADVAARRLYWISDFKKVSYRQKDSGENKGTSLFCDSEALHSFRLRLMTVQLQNIVFSKQFILKQNRFNTRTKIHFYS